MAKRDYIAIAHAYADGILDGSIPSCLTVRQMAQRWKADLMREDIRLDETSASRVCKFLETLKHFKGLMAGQRLTLEPWQIFAFVNIFGWKKPDGRRRFMYADVLVPRKNGKTMMASGLALYMLFMDKEAGAEVYAAAVDREQAALCFEGSKELLKGSLVDGIAKVYRGEIKAPMSAGVYKPLSKETKNKDGLNPHAAVCDERHAWATNEIYDLIKTGMGARTQPLVFSISTAGLDTSLPYYADVQVLRDVLAGIKEKDNHFIMLFIPDEGDRYDDPATWAKVNPNLGVSVSESYMEAECAEAKMKGGSTLASFCVKNLNMWVDAPTVWVPDDDVRACCGPQDPEALKGLPCYAGVDLASKSDLLAVALYFPDVKAVVMKYLIPEAKVQELEDRVDYRLWKEQGWIETVPGKIIDGDWLVSWLLGVLEPYDVKCLAYDPWGAWNVIPKLTRYTDVLLSYQQSIRYMSVPTKELESMVLRHDINLMGNPILRWNFANVVIWQDANANIKLDKARSRNKIDGVVALVDAIGGHLTKGQNDSKELYKEHTLRVISL